MACLLTYYFTFIW